jgi:hypothetical protein
MNNKWETVENNKDRETLRMKVASGWLYYVIEKGDYGGQLDHTLCFVPAAERKKPSTELS